jgi:hypothetical protein
LTEQIDIDAGAARIAHWRGEPMGNPPKPYSYDEWAGAIRRADVRRQAIVGAIVLAKGQHEVLAGQLSATRTTAKSLFSTLSEVKEAALVDLDNPEAGDAFITALSTLSVAIDAALLALTYVPSLSYEVYRDE